jgi:hypothetical protein
MRMDHINIGPSNEELDARDAKNAAEGKLARVKVLRDGSGPKKLTATEPEKMAQEREEFREKAIADGQAEDLLMAPSPMEELVARHREPGMAYGFMSDAAVKQLGTRNYKPVLDERGEPVRLGTLTLGKIPEALQQARQKKQQDESESLIKGIKAEYQQRVSAVKRDAKDLGLQVMDPREDAGIYVDPQSGRRIQIG